MSRISSKQSLKRVHVECENILLPHARRNQSVKHVTARDPAEADWIGNIVVRT